MIIIIIIIVIIIIVINLYSADNIKYPKALYMLEEVL